MCNYESLIYHCTRCLHPYYTDPEPILFMSQWCDEAIANREHCAYFKDGYVIQAQNMEQWGELCDECSVSIAPLGNGSLLQGQDGDGMGEDDGWDGIQDDWDCGGQPEVEESGHGYGLALGNYGEQEYNDSHRGYGADMYGDAEMHGEACNHYNGYGDEFAWHE
jgi:hypothetical protein